MQEDKFINKRMSVSEIFGNNKLQGVAKQKACLTHSLKSVQNQCYAVQNVGF